MAHESLEQTKKRELEFVSDCMLQLGTALNQEIPEERIALYIRALSDLSERQLAFGFERALKLFKPEFGKTFPAPSEIREWAEELVEIPIGRKFNSVADIDPEKCPKGWIPEDVFAAHLTQEKIRGDSRRPRFDDERPLDFSDLEVARRKSGITPADTARWLAEGKAAQREQIARLEADPEWQAMAQRLGGKPGFKPVTSTVPKDPAERKRWARENARKNGWIREPGEDWEDE